MIFQVVPSRDRSLYRVLKRAPERRAASGDVLWRPGDEAGVSVYVLEGLVAVRGPGGRAAALGGPGHLVALEALAAPPRFRTLGEALADVRYAAADGAAVLRALRRGIHTLPGLVGALHRRGLVEHQRSAGAGGEPAAQRLAEVVLDLHARLAEGEGAWLPRGITHQLLGELAGLHRATVTTLLNDWIYHDWLDQDGRRLRVADAAALGAVAHVDRAHSPG